MRSRVRLFATLWTVALQAPLSMGFAKQAHWSGLPFLSPRESSPPWVEPTFSESPALQADYFLVESIGKPRLSIIDSYLLISIKPIKKQGEMKLAVKDESYRWQLLDLKLNRLQEYRILHRSNKCEGSCRTGGSERKSIRFK